jgi:hypothetical protein
MSESKPVEQYSVGIAVEFDEPAAKAGLHAALEIVGAHHIIVEPAPIGDADAVVVVAVDAVSEANARATVDVALEVSDATAHGPVIVETGSGVDSPARMIANLLDEFPAV